MPEQQIQEIDVKDLVLWSENPRDPISASLNDQTIVNRALREQASKWTIPKLAREMGQRYDYSELPTVVYHRTRPVVYDGNRRIILGKIKLGLVFADGIDPNIIAEYPSRIPCNVCEQRIALENILRKHSESGSWKPLERDVFLNKHMHQEKSIFLLFDENTGLISGNEHLNQGFVKEEILREETLKRLGFRFDNGSLLTVHSQDEAKAILEDLSRKIASKTITTRKNRGKVLEVLDRPSKDFVRANAEKRYKSISLEFDEGAASRGGDAPRLTPRSRKENHAIFGQKLVLRNSDTNGLYRDITDLYHYYSLNQAALSPRFPNLIRMALRLLCDTAAKESSMQLDAYVNKYYPEGKKKLGQDEKTFLSNHTVTAENFSQLLHTGAHSYSASSNVSQMLAMSIILGQILILSHGK